MFIKSSNSQVGGDCGDLAKFGKKRITDHDFHPPFVKCGVGK